MSKRKKDNIAMLGFALKRPTCTYPGCTNKARRVGRRKYSDRCHLHPHRYGAA